MDEDGAGQHNGIIALGPYFFCFYGKTYIGSLEAASKSGCCFRVMAGEKFKVEKYCRYLRDLNFLPYPEVGQNKFFEITSTMAHGSCELWDERNFGKI